jgi:hypothetical protein
MRSQQALEERCLFSTRSQGIASAHVLLNVLENAGSITLQSALWITGTGAERMRQKQLTSDE